jgi:hypothetical protein
MPLALQRQSGQIDHLGVETACFGFALLVLLACFGIPLSRLAPLFPVGKTGEALRRAQVVYCRLLSRVVLGPL